MAKKGLFIGLTTVDIQYFVDKFPQPNTKVKAEIPLLAAGGPAANAAITFSHLGGEADFLTCIGQNTFQKLILEDFKKYHINAIDFIDDENFSPIVATVITTTSNSDRTILTHHPEAVQKQMTKDIVKIKDYAFIFVDGFYSELAIPICIEAKKLGIPVIFDGGSWKPQLPDLIPHIDIAVCSDNYLPPACNSTDEVIKYMKQYGVKHVAITRGEDSIVGDNFSIEIEKVNAIDSLGAGDVLHGALCWFLASGMTFYNALNEASKVATFSTLYKGTRTWMNTNLPI